MNYNEKHDTALMRYSAIAPAVNDTLPDGQSLHAFFADAAAHPYTASPIPLPPKPKLSAGSVR